MIDFVHTEIIPDIQRSDVNERLLDGIEEVDQFVMVLFERFLTAAGEGFRSEIVFNDLRDTFRGDDVHALAADFEITHCHIYHGHDITQQGRILSDRAKIEGENRAEVFVTVFIGHKKHILS